MTVCNGKHTLNAESDMCTKCGMWINQMFTNRAGEVVQLQKQERPDLSLNPLIAEIAMAEAFMVGAKKYGRSDYEAKGGSVSEHVAAIKRHIGKYMRGENRDPDGQLHLGSVLARVAMLLRQEELGKLTDDRYKGESK